MCARFHPKFSLGKLIATETHNRYIAQCDNAEEIFSSRPCIQRTFANVNLSVENAIPSDSYRFVERPANTKPTRGEIIRRKNRLIYN